VTEAGERLVVLHEGVTGLEGGIKARLAQGFLRRRGYFSMKLLLFVFDTKKID